MATIKLPAYLKWREGRPRWEPGPKLRHGGWRGRDLKRDNGDWLPLGEAIAAAQALNDEVAAWRGGGAKRVPRRRAQSSTRTLDALYQKWTGAPEFKMLRETTRADYEQKAQVFIREIGGDKAVASLARRHIKALWREMFDKRGHPMANAVIAVARTMLTFAVDLDWISDNPAYKLKLKTVPPRVVIWLPTEIAHFCDIVDRINPQIVDAVIIALHTGQRRGDVLTLEDAKTVNGRTLFKQSKTGARVSVPHTPQLADRLEAIKQRRIALHNVVDLALLRRTVLRADQQHFSRDTWAHEFRAARTAAAKEMPSIAGLRFQDLRDTAVTRLALASCTAMEIHAITGHDLETIHRVMKHYLARTDALADAAITKLKTWMSDEGIAL